MNWFLTFEAVRGGVSGDIALDDVTLTLGSSCPETPRECDFEATECDFIQVNLRLNYTVEQYFNFSMI